jgi:S-adenosylmethionine-diacylgycerolhomoserine-N-methlytransferase
MIGAEMDAIYRVQRHFYDFTRKPYLLGRDVMIRELDLPVGGSVIEIGCGTARNLLSISRRYPTAFCFGIDISTAMLQTARVSIAREHKSARIRVEHADATSLDPILLFGTPKFDRVIFSYTLSMIPEWQPVLRNAANLLAPGGSLHVADFGDQSGLPTWFRNLLFGWLGCFSVTPRLELRDQVTFIARTRGWAFRFKRLYRGYVVLAELHAPARSRTL